MGARIAAAVIIGVAIGMILTRTIIVNDFIRIWLVNVPSLLVWASAFVAGIVVALIAPYGMEIWLAIVTMFMGSLVGVVIFGTGLNFSLADQSVLTYILTTLLISGVSLIVLAWLGSWAVAGVRNRQDSQPTRYNRRRRGQYQTRYREPPDRY